MASGSSLSSMQLFGNKNEEENNHVLPQAQPETVPHKKRRNPPGVPYPDAEVIALSPTTLMAKNRFVCEVCYKGFPRDQNLQLHKRGHNLPWKLKQKTKTDDLKRKVYLCPEPSCINHEPSHALGDLTGIKKHYYRKHGEKKYKCQKCEKMYAVKSDLKAHLKTCCTKEYQCHCGTIFSRRDSFINHRAFCEALADGIQTISPAMGLSSFKSTSNHNHNHNHPTQMNINVPQLGSQLPSTRNLNLSSSDDITPGVSQMTKKSYNSVMIRTSMDCNYHKPPPPLFAPSSSSDQHNQHKYDQRNFDTSFFTNLMNNTTTHTLHNNMQLYNFSFMGNSRNSGCGDQGTSIVSSDHSASLYLSSHSGSIAQLSATGLLQKAAILGSTSSNGHHSNMNELINSFSGSRDYEKEWKFFNSVEQQQQAQSSSLNMGFEQFSGVKTTRDFLGIGVEIVGNISSDGPKSTFAGRSFL